MWCKLWLNTCRHIQRPQVRCHRSEACGTASACCHKARPQLTRKNCMRGTASVMPPHTTEAAMAILLSRAICCFCSVANV